METKQESALRQAIRDLEDMEVALRRADLLGEADEIASVREEFKGTLRT